MNDDVTTSPAVPDAASLTSAGDSIQQALQLAGERLDPGERERARAELERVDQRLALGVDHTVVALVGGTGSGKSSLFNAISGLDFADVGVIRPTTAEAAACSWGSKASALLDFLGVAPHRRIQRDSVLDHDAHRPLHGLVLLDLPDHDSIEQSHARQVDRLLPVVDLLVWVVDPQKYADNVLHERYLRALVDRQESMIVVVNQVDTIPAEAHEQIRDDVARLLAHDGLDEVDILLTSVRAGTGLGAVREKIAEVAGSASVSARTAQAQLRATAARLRDLVGPTSPDPEGADDVAARVAKAAGVTAVAESIRAALASPAEVALSATQRPARSRLDAIRERWLSGATAGLGDAWASSVREPVADAESFAEDVWQAIRGVPLPPGTDPAARLWRRIGWAGAVIGAAALIAAVVLWVAAPSAPDALVPVLAGVGALALLVAVVLLLAARRRRTTRAEQAATAYHTAVEAALRDVVDRDLVTPAAGPRAEHERVLRALPD